MEKELVSELIPLLRELVSKLRDTEIEVEEAVEAELETAIEIEPMTATVQIKKVRDGAVIPEKKNQHDAGYDLHACLTGAITIPPGKVARIPTGLSIAVPNGYFGAIFARSGLATKKGLRPTNCVGVCDAPYRGEYIVAMYNDGSEPVTIQPNDRIAQLVIIPHLSVAFEEVDELEETERGEGGFGSTGR